MKKPNNHTEDEQKPPFFKRWADVYALVLLVQLLLVLFFYFITQYFS